MSHKKVSEKNPPKQVNVNLKTIVFALRDPMYTCVENYSQIHKVIK